MRAEQLPTNIYKPFITTTNYVQLYTVKNYKFVNNFRQKSKNHIKTLKIQRKSDKIKLKNVIHTQHQEKVTCSHR